MNYEDIESSIEVTTYLILHLAVSFIEVGVLLGVGPPGGVGALPEVPLLHALYPRLSPCRLPRLQSGHIQLYTFCRYSTFKIFNVQGECMAIPSYIGWHYCHLSTFLFKFPKLRSFDRRQERSVNQELPTSQTNKTVRLLTESHCNTVTRFLFRFSSHTSPITGAPSLVWISLNQNWTGHRGFTSGPPWRGRTGSSSCTAGAPCTRSTGLTSDRSVGPWIHIVKISLSSNLRSLSGKQGQNVTIAKDGQLKNIDLLIMAI